MERARTRGQPIALAALDAILAAGGTHAVLLTGPAGVGKTTLALDLAAALLCVGGGTHPCRECRGCRMVDSGNHPDLHRLAPEGPGGQIRIGERSNPDAGTVRRLIADLSLLPVEGGARVAIIEQAHRLNDDAQSALLKTLEEPPAGVTIVLCADEEERLLPTIRSRCARVRLAPVGLRDIEALLGDHGAADAPTAARLGRLSQGRPGVALAWARVPEAVLARDSVARTFLDLLVAPRAARLGAARDLVAAGGEVGGALAGRQNGEAAPARPGRRGSSGRAAPQATAPAAGAAGAAPAGTGEASETAEGSATALRVPVAERRRAVSQVIEIWRDLARDLALAQLGETAAIRDVALLDDLGAAAVGLSPGAAATFLARLTRAGELLEANVSPDLLLDGLLLAWPTAERRPVATAR